MYLTVENLSAELFAEIKDNFFRENFWTKHVVHDLDCRINFFFNKGKVSWLSKGLSKENDEFFMSFEHVGNLFLDIFESLAKIDQQLVKDSKILYENLKYKKIWQNIEKKEKNHHCCQNHFPFQLH